MVKITKTLVAREGKYLIKPPHKEDQAGWSNSADPNVLSAGGDSAKEYPVHTRFVDFDKEFIYGYMETVSVSGKANLGMFNTNVEEVITWGAVAGAVDDTLVGILASSLDDETTAAANIFAGGALMPRTNPYGNYRIVSNTAYDGGRTSGEMDIVIEDPGLGAIVTASQGSCNLDRNPYTAMRCEWAAGNSSMSVVGVGLILPVAATYQWVQVIGPCMLLGDEAAGKAAYLRTVWWHIDGSVVATGQGTHTDSHQPVVAGFILGKTSSSYCWFIQMNRLG